MHPDIFPMRAVDEQVVEGGLRVMIPIRNHRRYPTWQALEDGSMEPNRRRHRNRSTWPAIEDESTALNLDCYRRRRYPVDDSKELSHPEATTRPV